MATTANEYDWSSGKPTIAADVDSDLDYSRDWTAWLNGDTIQSFVPVYGAGLKAGVNPSTNTSTATVIWCAIDKASPGYKIGNKVPLTHRITTAMGRKEDFTVYLKLEEH